VDIISYVENGYDREQLRQIRHALAAHLDIDPYLKPEYYGSSIREIVYGLRYGVDVDEYADAAFTWRKMREIRIGLQNRVDVSKYKNPYYSYWQMREIRLGLEEGLDVDSYKSLMNTAKVMHKKRLELEKQSQNVAVTGEWKRVSFEFGKFYISGDEMQVSMEVTDFNWKPDESDVRMILKENGFEYGVDDAGVAEVVSHAEHVGKQILVAAGKKPENGSDGYYEWHFENCPEMIPPLLEDGTADFKDLKWFAQVKKGQTLATYHAATAGNDGVTVKGRRIAAKKGKELARLSGQGFSVLENGNIYVAAIDGHVRHRRFHLDVEPLLVIDELDVENREITFDGSIYIRGNVENNYCITATGDIVVDGSVHSSILNCKRNVLVRHGMNAVSGDAVIRAEGNILGGYFESAEIFAGKNIYLSSCLNSDLTAKGEIVTFGRKGGIIGGSSYAEKGFCISNAGNDMEKQTCLQLGITREMKEKYAKFEEELREVREDIQKLELAHEEMCVRYPAVLRNAMKIFIRMEDTIHVKKEELEEIISRQKVLHGRITRAMGAQIIVDGTLYPNVLISFDNEHFTPQQISHAAIKYNNHAFHVEEIIA
jgi:uncharacterized protein (DUF342 family)